MKRTKNCKHCNHEFVSRRTNHVYCSQSCKTLASYKRNIYSYVSGHYQKQEIEDEEKLVPMNKILDSIKNLEEQIQALHSKKETINGTSIGNAALGTALADGVAYGAKAVFAPSLLPATKNDIEMLNNKIESLKYVLKRFNSNF